MHLWTDGLADAWVRGKMTNEQLYMGISAWTVKNGLVEQHTYIV